MAFIDFSQAAALAPVHAAPAAVVPTASPASDEFSPLERRVLALAHFDGLDTLEPPRGRSWLGRLLFGPPPPSRALANERLEALRRLAVETRHKGWQVRPSAIKAAKAAGFSETQIGRVIDGVGPAPTLAQRNFA
jgi:hypothetical protein